MAEPEKTSYHATADAPLVSLDVAKEFLKITDPAYDAEVTRMSHDATDAILDYLKHGADPAWTVDTVPRPVRAAILILLGNYDSHRGDDMGNEAAGMGDKAAWEAIDRLLARFRDPAIA